LIAIDRDTDASFAAVTGDFDAAVDVARRPSHVRKAIAALSDRVGHWSFVSSCSVYADNERPGQRAGEAPVLTPTDGDIAEGEQYGPAKVACERAYDRSAFICRAGLIVGPGDPSGRFAYWVRRLGAGGPVVAPGSPEDAVQFIDVRDLAAWLVAAAERRLAGAFDGIAQPISRGEFIATGAAALETEVDAVWMDQAFLAAQDVVPWMGPRSIPLWLPLPEYTGFMSRDVSPSLVAGLTVRPITETFVDTARWVANNPSVNVTGLTDTEHFEVITAWRDRP
jgi:nucleoside-diphosphate-sugar epimerase